MTTIILILSMFCAVFPGKKTFHTPSSGESLLVFYQRDTDSSFLNNEYRWLKEIAENQQLNLIVFDEKAGFPEQVTATPALMFWGKHGPALFGGKYRERAAVENFLRISRLSPVPSRPDLRRNLLCMKHGRQQVAIPLKITPQQGGYEQQKDWQSLLVEAFESQGVFVKKDSLQLWPGDRKYYLDLHPWVEADGRMYLTVALFSQFDCIAPVWNNFEKPFVGNIQNPAGAIGSIVAKTDSVIAAFVAGSAGNESLSAVPANGRFFDLDSLSRQPGFEFRGSIPEYAILTETVFTRANPASPDLPMLTFNFPAPLDRYAGEIKKLEARLSFSPQFDSISGSVVAEVKSMTMGMRDLDKKVLKSYLQSLQKYPKASLNSKPFGFRGHGRRQSPRLQLPGIFRMMDKSMPLVTEVLLEPLCRKMADRPWS
ncbi:MAG: hypothetical protein R3B47_11710 [Bacteroidia bacterium]